MNADPSDVSGPALAAQIRPTAVAVATDDSILITEQHINRVSRISSGQISTIAGQAEQFRGDDGSANPPGAGDGGPAPRALLGGPSGVVVTSSGDMLFSERYTHRVRRILARPLKRVASPFPIVAGGAGSAFSAGARLVSSSGNHYLVFQTDGNLVVYTTAGTPVWALNASRGRPYADAARGTALFTADGNLLTKARDDSTVWQTATSGNPGAQLDVDDAGTLIVRSAGDLRLWSSA